MDLSQCYICAAYTVTHNNSLIFANDIHSRSAKTTNDSQVVNCCRIKVLRFRRWNKMVERRAPIILYNLVRKETTSSIATLQICIFFLAILWTLCEVPADHSRRVCRRFPDDCTLLHMNLRITYMTVLQRMFRLLVTCTVPSGGGVGVGCGIRGAWTHRTQPVVWDLLLGTSLALRATDCENINYTRTYSPSSHSNNPVSMEMAQHPCSCDP